MRKEVQNQVLDHLKQYGSITQLEAFQKYKCMRLAAVIIRLRSRYNIQTVMETDKNTGSTYARYVYMGIKEEGEVA